MLTARAAGQDHIDQATLDRIRNLYRGTTTAGITDNTTRARTRRPRRGSASTKP